MIGAAWALIRHYLRAHSLHRIHSPLLFRLLAEAPPPGYEEMPPNEVFVRRLAEALGVTVRRGGTPPQGDALWWVEWPVWYADRRAAAHPLVAVDIRTPQHLQQWVNAPHPSQAAVITFPSLGIRLRHPVFRQGFHLPLYPAGWYPGCRPRKASNA